MKLENAKPKINHLYEEIVSNDAAEMSVSNGFARKTVDAERKVKALDSEEFFYANPPKDRQKNTKYEADDSLIDSSLYLP